MQRFNLFFETNIKQQLTRANVFGQSFMKPGREYYVLLYDESTDKYVPFPKTVSLDRLEEFNNAVTRNNQFIFEPARDLKSQLKWKPVEQYPNGVINLDDDVEPFANKRSKRHDDFPTIRAKGWQMMFYDAAKMSSYNISPDELAKVINGIKTGWGDEERPHWVNAYGALDEDPDEYDDGATSIIDSYGPLPDSEKFLNIFPNRRDYYIQNFKMHQPGFNAFDNPDDLGSMLDIFS